MTTLRFVEKLRDLVGGVDVVLSDIWGVVHNGLVAFPEACEALHSFRAQGGTVILITNAPRPADSVRRQLHKLGVADATYDAIVSSGDLTRHFVADHPGRKMFWIGPERDSSIHRGLDAVLAPLEQADLSARHGAGRRAPGPCDCAQPRACDRGFGADGSGRRPRLRDRLPVRDPRHPCRGLRRHRSTGPRLGEGAVRPSAAGADPGAKVVGGSRRFYIRRPGERRDPYAVASRFKTVADAIRSKQRMWLWVPAFAGTTPGPC